MFTNRKVVNAMDAVACIPNTAWSGSSEATKRLNESCFCISLDSQSLRKSMQSALTNSEVASSIEERFSFAFAPHPVFISAGHVHKIKELISAVESVVKLPAYQAAALAGQAPIARYNPGTKGVFFGYDFHLDGDDVALIEINTNAGGAMLNAALAKAQRACCQDVEQMLPRRDATGFEMQILRMFEEEWRLAGRTGPLRTIAIVDEAPGEQYLYPEFLLFQQLFRRHGMDAVIADPAELVYQDGILWCGKLPIDLVYNRLTDFMLELPSCMALRRAYMDRATITTPHPYAHALYANKRNLVTLTSAERLTSMAVPSATSDTLLRSIPSTEIVNGENAERLWSERRQLFFKPVAGYGSRAAYRGDKVTTRVWEKILGGNYIAQRIVAPTERMIFVDASRQTLKFDVRAYVYDGAVQWLAARLYQGQTTNFRTPGGGFAPLYQLY